jgi:hypothetical protein
MTIPTLQMNTIRKDCEVSSVAGQEVNVKYFVIEKLAFSHKTTTNKELFQKFLDRVVLPFYHFPLRHDECPALLFQLYLCLHRRMQTLF